MMILNPKWNLDSLFEGGSHSLQFKTYLATLKNDIEKLLAAMSSELSTIIPFQEEIYSRLQQATSFIHCLRAQSTEDQEAVLLQSQVMNLHASYGIACLTIERRLASLSDLNFQDLLREFETIAYPLEEKRRLAKEKLSFDQEALINDLAIDGFHGWSQLYDTLIGQINIFYEKDGDTTKLSVGQAQNMLTNNDRNERQTVFKALTNAWESQKELFAQTLNHLGGFRLKVNDHRKQPSILREPLETHRMSKEILDTMWSVIDLNKGIFAEYLISKAKLMNLKKLSWCDVTAPIGGSTTKFSYSQGASFITEQFGHFSPKLASFAQKTFDHHWNEVEDRPGKQPGGFCTSFPLSRQSRIFMTFSGTQENLTTLAHELGHAYHNEIIFSVPPLAQNYPMSLAETASTLAEQIISEAALKLAKTKEERLTLLDNRIQRSITFFMNIQARFLFELAFYEERQQGYVSAERLCILMEDAQRKAFCHSLEEYDPYFWISKLHFYITTVPFYNFPYTFGYLFSLGLYAKALENLEEFNKKYEAFLLDSGRMPVEAIAKKHWDVDLTQPGFWQSAMDIAIADVRSYTH